MPTTIAASTRARRSATPDPIEARLSALEAAVARLSLHVEQFTGQTRPDDAAFLAAIAASVRGHVFSARELVNHATVDRDLRAALAGVTSAKRIGKRLHRLAGQGVGGFRLCRVDRDRDGTIWSVQVVDDLHAND
jgi:hypothetical protein